jgi:hypothetical protein
MIIVHVGLRKAGSTSIQNFLHKNENALRGLSIEYPGPRKLTRNNHLALAREIRGQTPVDAGGGVLREIAVHWRVAAADTMILSAEAFEECETSEAVKLGALRRTPDEAVIIVLILKDLVDLMWSSYAQMVKVGVKTHDFDAFFDKRIVDRRVDYFATASRWADAFGWDNLRVRLLDRDHLLNGDLIDDFLGIAGVDPDSPAARGLRRTGVANVSPGWRGIEAIRALYGDRHGLPATHPLADATDHSRDTRTQIGRRALEIGARRGWNDDRGRYLTREQARRCLEVNRAAVKALNGRLSRDLPAPVGLKQRGFRDRKTAPDVSQIPAAELRDFYDELGGRV